MIFIDSHVHIHPCFQLDRFLDAAYSNFRSAAWTKASGSHWQAIVLLTESGATNVFQKLSDNETTSLNTCNAWQFEKTSEDMVVKAVGPDSKQMLISAGRQIVTAERLEVLCLGSRIHVEDKQPIRQTIEYVLNAGALAVLPWGPGKWFGGRGQVVQDMLKYFGANLWLGDNGNRPVFWTTPKIFELAVSAGHKILPGSDPLPFPSENGRAGCFGFMMDGAISGSHPLRDVMSRLRQADTRLEPFGRLESCRRFFRNQLTMQLINKRLKHV